MAEDTRDENVGEWDGWYINPIFQIEDGLEAPTRIGGSFLSYAPSKRDAEVCARVHMAALLRKWGLNVRLRPARP